MTDLVFASIEEWTRTRIRGTAAQLPVASNLPDCRDRRETTRSNLAIDAETTVLAAFGTGHPSRQIDYLRDAANAVAADGRRVMLLNIGAGAPDLNGVD